MHWWQRIRQAIEQRPGRISNVTVRKCNSHLDEVSLRANSQPWYVSLGNERADALAQRGLAKAMNLIQPQVERLQEYEALLQRVHKRLAAIAMEVFPIPRERHQRRQPARGGAKISTPRLGLEKASGHLMVRHPKDIKRWFWFHCK